MLLARSPARSFRHAPVPPLIPSLLLALAAATPSPRTDDGSLARAGQVPEARWYARLDGLEDGGPVAPRWSRRDRSTYRVWEFPDGVVERAWVRDRGRVVEERFFDLRGWPTETITFADDEVPAEGVVHLAEPVTVSFAGWSLHDVAGARMAWPAPPANGAGAVAGGMLHVFTEPAADVTAPAYVERWLKDCGCVLVERHPIWIDGEAGVRLRLRTLAVGAPDVAMVWAVPRVDGVWTATYVVKAAADGDAALAPGRLALRLVRWLEAD